jgi:hypothetical protein
MRAWKLTLFLMFVFAVSACAPKPAEQPETAPATDTSSTPTPPSEPTPAPTPEPAAPPAPAAKAAPKPVVKAKPAEPPVAASAPAAQPEAPLTASRDRDVTPPPAPKKPEPVIVPSGTELNIILSDALNSGKVKPGDTFEASLAAPVYVNGVEVLERGSKIEGKVVAAEGAGRVSGKANMTLTLTSIRDDGKTLTLSTKDLAAEAESTTGRDVKVIGGTAGVGAIIGAIAGGKKGAATGAAIGGAAGTGTVLATKGKEVEYPAESKLTFIIDRDLRL